MISTSISRDPQDAHYGWITDVPPNLTMNKGTACRIYLLGFGDLGDRDDVSFRDLRIADRYYCKEYKERHIEWRAWEIHGGPIEYWNFLKEELRNKRLESNLLPYSYRRGGRYDLNLAAPPVLQDRYVCDSIVLRDAKRALPAWIWNACNVVLDDVFLDGRIPLWAKDLTSDREDAMKLAVAFVRAQPQLYANRPEQALGPSPCMTTLRKVLREAPIAPNPGSKEWDNPVPGLDFMHTETLDFYDWNVEYLERVFTAACNVAEKLGPHAQGWAEARWEVYDKYSQLPGLALCYDHKEKEWLDNAADWLDGKLSRKDLPSHLRGKCSAGIAFNKLLPKSSSSSSPGQHTSQAGSSAVSSGRSPSAARSSA